MANKDYVRRGNTSRKKPQKKPQKKTQKKKTTTAKRPWRSGILAIVVVLIFGYGLYQLNSEPQVHPSKPAKKTVETSPKPVPVATPKAKAQVKTQNALPPPPTEKWDYVETLPNRQIKVVPKKLPVSKIPYVMQCGAYKTLKQAEARKAQIAFQGLVSKVHKKENSTWFRVVLGPYKFKRDAERDKHKLQRAKIEPCAIWKDTQ